MRYQSTKRVISQSHMEKVSLRKINTPSNRNQNTFKLMKQTGMRTTQQKNQPGFVGDVDQDLFIYME